MFAEDTHDHKGIRNDKGKKTSTHHDRVINDDYTRYNSIGK